MKLGRIAALIYAVVVTALMIALVFYLYDRNFGGSQPRVTQPIKAPQSVEPYVLGGGSVDGPESDIDPYPISECDIHPERCAPREIPERFPDEVGVSSSPSICSPAYPTVCLPPAPPDLQCADIPYRRFKVLAPDPHHFDGNHNGIGCE
jgi:hypothetical protein